MFLLLALLLPYYFINLNACPIGPQKEIRLKTTIVQLQKISKQLFNYHQKHKHYPKALGLILKSKDLEDAWENEWVYMARNGSFKLYSIGKNNMDEYSTGDDLSYGQSINKTFYPEIN